PAPRARHGLLQPHRVRVGDGPPRLAGHDLRRRAVRRADRADGGQPAPAIGFGLGIERLLLLLEELGLHGPDLAPAAYCVLGCEEAAVPAMAAAEALRAQG